MCLPTKTAAAGCQCNATLTDPFLERCINFCCTMTPIEGKERKKHHGKVHPSVGLVVISIPGIPGAQDSLLMLCPHNRAPS